jgi:hypothetical protein
METIEHDFHLERRFPGTVGGGTLVVCRSDGAGSVRAEVAGS